jgi:hypothetical protein
MSERSGTLIGTQRLSHGEIDEITSKSFRLLAWESLLVTDSDLPTLEPLSGS